MPVYLKKLLVKLSVYFLIFLLLLILLWVPGAGLCPYSRFFNMSCPVCGATRCFFSLLRLDIKAAVSYNAVFALGIYPVLFLTVGTDLFMSFVNLFKKQNKPTLFDYFSTL